MSFLILYVHDGCKFDIKEMIDAFERHNQASRLEPDDKCRATFMFETHEDSTIIRIKDDCESVVIDGSGDASLYAALLIQSVSPVDVHMVDESYSFDVSLREVTTVEELKDRVSGL